jgi:hypothetical protein
MGAWSEPSRQRRLIWPDGTSSALNRPSLGSGPGSAVAGDLPGALRHLDDAAGRYAELGVAVPGAALDRCAVLLATLVLLQARFLAGRPPGRLLAALRSGRPRLLLEWSGRRLSRRGRRPGGDRGRLVLHRPGRVTTPSQGRRTPGDGGVCSAEVVSSTSPASAGMSVG